ncbi:MAG: NADH-quinone oxidoreductase subunit L, partial [Ilumatobacteraceae bacterium]
MLDLVWLIPALPLLGFLVILVAGRKMGDPGAGYFATAMVALSFVVTAGVFIDLQSLDAEARTEQVHRLFSWVAVGGLKVDLAFLADPLAITMCLFVTGIGTLIHLYA